MYVVILLTQITKKDTETDFFKKKHRYGRDPSTAVTNNQYIVLVKMVASVETSPETHEFSYKDLGVESDDAKA